MVRLLKAPNSIRTSRDILLLRLARGRALVVTCDAAGGIGSKPQDSVRADPRLVGMMTARVALMELLATGTNPVALVAALPVEPKPTANLLIEGIKDEVRNAGLCDLPLLCSSEKNVPVTQTGIGVTTLGFASYSQLKISRCKPGDNIIAVGDRCVGQEVVQAEKDRKIADTLDVLRLREQPQAHELIPVGSRGILFEARLLANDSGLVFKPNRSQTINLKKSAGPATVLLCALRRGAFPEAKSIFGTKPTRKIGSFEKG